MFPDDAVLARPLGTGVFGAPVPVLRAVPVVWNTTRSTALVTHDAGGRYDILFYPALVYQCKSNSNWRSIYNAPERWLGSLGVAVDRGEITAMVAGVLHGKRLPKDSVAGLEGSENRGGSEAQPVIRVCCSP